MTNTNNVPPRAPNKEEELNKMTSGGEELRDHDFPASVEQLQRRTGPAAVDTGAPPPEEVQSGGKMGEVKGDAQKVGDAGAIFDQNRANPTSFADR